MAAEYRIDVHNAAGTKVAEITDYLSLSYYKKVNDVGTLQFMLEGNHRDISKFERNGIIIVYRKNTARGITSWQADFYGLFLAQYRKTTQIDYFTVTAPSVDVKLGWRVNAYYANTTNFTLFSSAKAETIMKRLVRYNFDPVYASDTASGRLRTPVQDLKIRIATDLARGNTLDYQSSYAPVLKDLQALALIAGGDFGLVAATLPTFNLEFYPNQLGTNRTSTIVFSLDNANMNAPEYKLDWINEKTAAIVAGQGQDANRDIVTRTSPTLLDGYDVETFVDARNVVKGNTSALNAEGDKALQKFVANETFDFSVLQNVSFYYGASYFLGDKVTAKYKDITTALKITGVKVDYKKQGSLEKIDLDLSPIPFT